MLLLLACVDSKEPLDTSAADTDSDTDTDTDTVTVPEGLNGEVPDAPVPLPSFTARAQDGSTRTEADLIDQRAVMWFYPAAGTAG